MWLLGVLSQLVAVTSIYLTVLDSYDLWGSQMSIGFKFLEYIMAKNDQNWPKKGVRFGQKIYPLLIGKFTSLIWQKDNYG